MLSVIGITERHSNATAYSALSSGCECNNHAQRCRFDRTVYEASGRRSGGVCEGCLHHTTGPKCDQCAEGYQPNPRSQMDRPDACIREWSFREMS